MNATYETIGNWIMVYNGNRFGYVISFEELVEIRERLAAFVNAAFCQNTALSENL